MSTITLQRMMLALFRRLLLLVLVVARIHVHAFSVTPPCLRVAALSGVSATIPSSSTVLLGKKEAREQGNERKNKTERVKKVKDDVIEVQAVVLESLPNAMFRCSINDAPETQEPVQTGSR